MSFINTPPQISIPITGSAETFPVHQIYCVGRNYQKHISEMGYSQEKTVPFVLFLKPPDAVVQNGQTIKGWRIGIMPIVCPISKNWNSA